MFRLLGKLFSWLTFLSLIFWIGVCVYIVQKQPVELPPSGWPASYQGCMETWSAVEGAPMGNRCLEYYSLLGDRTTPLQARFLSQTQGRLSEKVISTYLALYPLQPGQSVTPQEIMKALGTKRIVEIVYQVVKEADQPPSTARRVTARCKLETTARFPGIDERDLMQTCARN